MPSCEKEPDYQAEFSTWKNQPLSILIGQYLVNLRLVDDFENSKIEIEEEAPLGQMMNDFAVGGSEESEAAEEEPEEELEEVPEEEVEEPEEKPIKQKSERKPRKLKRFKSS